MNLDEITLGEVKELKSLLGFNGGVQKTDNKRYIGEYVIIRSRNEGINSGEVIEYDETGIILKNARRIYYHKPSDKKTSWYEGVSVSGLSSDSKISCPVLEKAIVEDYSITLCTEDAKESLKNHKSHEQN